MSRRAQPKAKKSKTSGGEEEQKKSVGSNNNANTNIAIPLNPPRVVPAPIYPPGRTLVTYSLTNTPALVYDVALILDKGMIPTKWTSYRLREEVLYLETAKDRYELRSDGSRDGFVTYTLSKVSDPMALFLAGENSVPVKDAHKVAIAQNVDWSSFIWGPDSLCVSSNNVTLLGLKTARFDRCSGVTYVEVADDLTNSSFNHVTPATTTTTGTAIRGGGK